MGDHRCMHQQKGGACNTSALIGDCSYYVEQAGEIDINELTGIDDYKTFCLDGSLEFDKVTDRGVGLRFWDGFGDDQMCKRRMHKLSYKFQHDYPDLVVSLGEPPCI